MKSPRVSLRPIILCAFLTTLSAGAQPADPNLEIRADTPTPTEPSAVPGGWPEDARGLLQRPGFVCTDPSGETSVCARLVSFCGHEHKPVFTLRFKPVDEEQLARGRDMLDVALAKYPLQLLSSHLERVNFVGFTSLLVFPQGQSNNAVLAGGTYGDRTLYVSLETRPGRPYISRDAETIFHHELSSLLVGEHPDLFDDKAWLAANPPDFKYDDDLKRGPELSTNYLAEGFASQYGMSTLENDINTYAQGLFTRSDWLLPQAAAHPHVQQKLDVLLDFYGRLDPGFTREFFRRHCRTTLTAAEQQQVAEFTQAIATEATKRTYSRRATLYNNLKLYPEAILDAETALGIDPQYGRGYYVRGYARWRTGALEEALADFARAIELDPAWVPSYLERAEVYELMGKMAEAQQDRKTAQALEAAPAGTP